MNEVVRKFNNYIKEGYEDSKKKSFNDEKWKQTHYAHSRFTICSDWSLKWKTLERTEPKKIKDIELHLDTILKLYEYDIIKSIFDILDIMKRSKPSLFKIYLIAYHLGNLKYTTKNRKMKKGKETNMDKWLTLNQSRIYTLESYINLYECRFERYYLRGGATGVGIPAAQVEGYKYGASSPSEEAILALEHESNEQMNMLNGNDNGNEEHEFHLMKGGSHTVPQFQVGNVEGAGGTMDTTVNNAKLLLQAQENSRFDEFDPNVTQKGGRRRRRTRRRKGKKRPRKTRRRRSRRSI